jgi:uncharacterized protein
MSKRLPEHLDPWRFADLGETFAGSVALQDLSRLRESLLDDQGRASFELEFYRDERRRACLKGRVEATLLLECQRCLKAVRLKVSSDTAIAFVEGFDEAEQLPEALDPWMVEDQRVSLQDLIEDELLLALPQVAMHPADECTATDTGARGDTAIEAADEAERENPFAILSGLKATKD